MTIAERKAPALTEARHFPIFDKRPHEEFVERWKEYIAETGYPELFENVSTSRPYDMAGIVVLSGELKIPRVRRLDGALVPCPLCSAGAPKFEIGVLAWFPAERTIMCIGHDCARRHLGEEYVAARQVYNRESKARRFVDVWSELQERAPRLREIGWQLMPIATAIENARKQFENEAPGFLDVIHGEYLINSGRISTVVDTGLRDQRRRKVYETVQIGTLVGREFLENKAPAKTLRAILRTLDGIDEPLPNWTPGDESNDALDEILRRGREIIPAIQKMKLVRDYVADARLFLHENNLKLFERWGELENSPFERLEFRRRGSWIFLDSVSFHGRHKAYFRISEDMFMPLPEASDSSFSIHGFGKVGEF
ncbi:hypothetical protein QTA58_00305 [Neorhizobium sp. CSC1952]|uniref:hypothetical protein n=1 Tax=Neorhizobium sp. CSC1952 TaxID=2978974 RepID=UPI0025A62C70|nr:hypothetical protein [Rhizobium sp. CSC1952]WJR67251.1 hypothetical protein QTA58_00305 [Rhizobium sp. CSC1952]